MGELSDTLRRNEALAFLANAVLVAEYPDGQEKIDAARQQIHVAMYRAALGQITPGEKEQIFAILAPLCPELFAAMPTAFHALPEDIFE
jgi:hypothetical protein